MAFGKRFDEWDRAAALMCLLNNLWSDDKVDDLAAFHPLLPDPGPAAKTKGFGTITDPRLLGGACGAVK